MADISILNDPNVAELLEGKTLVEAFRLGVLQDPEVQGLARGLSDVPIEANCWLDIVLPARRPAGPPRPMPLRLYSKDERSLMTNVYASFPGDPAPWEYGRLEEARRRFPNLTPNWSTRCLPFMKVIAARYDRFFELLRLGDLVAWGLGSRAISFCEVPRGIWSRDDWRVNFGTGDLWHDADAKPRFTSIELRRPVGKKSSVEHDSEPNSDRTGSSSQLPIITASTGAPDDRFSVSDPAQPSSHMGPDDHPLGAVFLESATGLTAEPAVSGVERPVQPKKKPGAKAALWEEAYDKLMNLLENKLEPEPRNGEEFGCMLLELLAPTKKKRALDTATKWLRERHDDVWKKYAGKEEGDKKRGNRSGN